MVFAKARATLTHINPQRPSVDNTPQLFASYPSLAEIPFMEQPKLRFAVGTFDTWQQVRVALHDLRVHGLLLNSFNCLALELVFAGKTILAPDQPPVVIEELSFPDSPNPIASTCGPLADCLSGRLRAGAKSLNEALAHWLIPRHAAHFQDAVEAGKILFWIPLTDAGDERRAYQTLLAHSSNSVGVHDLALPGE